MSLLNDFAQSCVFVAQSRTSDGAGGQITTYTPETTPFLCFIAETEEAETRTAERPEASVHFDLLFPVGIAAKFGDILKSEKGLYYRLTSSPIQAPALSSLNLQRCSAERWVLPT